MYSESILKALTLAKRNLVDMIYKNANVEGLGTTFPKTDAILNNAPTNTRLEEVLFIINMRDAYHFLFDNLDYANCVMLIRQLNKICGDKLFYGAGQARKQNVTIGGTSWVPPIPIESEVTDDINNINKIEDPVSKALAYFCYLCRTQIFIDGNKRVAQLIANKVLIENGIGILSIPVERLEEFDYLLVRYYETNDARDLCTFLCHYCIERV